MQMHTDHYMGADIIEEKNSPPFVFGEHGAIDYHHTGLFLLTIHTFHLQS